MKILSGKEFAKLVEKHGWQLLRVNGSHHIYGKTGVAIRLSIPIHAGENLKRGLLAHLAKQAGLTEKDVDAA